MLRFIKMRNKSGFNTNLQFMIDIKECGIAVKELENATNLNDSDRLLVGYAARCTRGAARPTDAVRIGDDRRHEHRQTVLQQERHRRWRPLAWNAWPATVAKTKAALFNRGAALSPHLLH